MELEDYSFQVHIGKGEYFKTWAVNIYRFGYFAGYTCIKQGGGEITTYLLYAE